MGPLLIYDTDGNIVATVDHVVVLNDQHEAVGLVDFAAHEAAGGEHTDIASLSQWIEDAQGHRTDLPVKGAKVWPEWLGARAHEFRVELAGPPGHKSLVALVHKASGHRRERWAIHQAIRETPEVDGVRDIRHLVGGPQRPLHLDEHGRTVSHGTVTGTPAHLPLIGRHL